MPIKKAQYPEPEVTKRPTRKKCVAVVRYGGFGDMLQTSSIFPLLKAQGAHVTLYTTDRGLNTTKEDPNIDDFVIQQDDQIPLDKMFEWWAGEIPKYDRWINFSESVEASWLLLPGRLPHTWPQRVRHKYFNVNYLEFMHDLAELPNKPSVTFYPTKEEREQALERKRRLGKCILWSLAGSSPHKAWPWLDRVIARSMLVNPDWKIVLVGDTLCQMLESGWENEPRVIRRSGVWSIRETLAFSQVADIVTGPETGILNCVSFMDMPKVITLSHSSVENLTRDWVNTTSLTPTGCPCYPCHQMHFNRNYCQTDPETGLCLCQTNISPEKVWDALYKYTRAIDDSVN